MFIPLGVKTDFSLLKSLIKIEDYILYAKNHDLMTIGILDDNLNSSYSFYQEAKKNNIKPIIGLEINVEEIKIYLYPRNYDGLVNLFKLMSNKEITLSNLKEFKDNNICVLNYESSQYISKMKEIFDLVFLSYRNDDERKNLSLITENLVYINEIYSLDIKSSKYINYLNMIKNNEKLGTVTLKDYNNNVISIEKYDNKSFADLIDIEFPEPKRYIPTYTENSYEYFSNLAMKGLYKRLNNQVNDKYKKRLLYEIDIINKMGFTDYFLIVFDYVRFAKKNKILIGAGRGSAAGSLVAYSLGITEIDPLKYDLLFERFLNPDRITMPDIDIDFEYTRVDEVFEYVKNKYGFDKVARIITYGTFQAKEALRTVGKINDVNESMLNSLLVHIDSKKSLKENLTNEVITILKRNSILKKIYEEAYFIEGLKKNESMHAAGVVISSVDLKTVIPVINKNDFLLSGYNMVELEKLGLLKMDFLALKNLTIILNILKSIDYSVDINNLPLDDEETYELFEKGETVGIFQFESKGLKNFLLKFKPTRFEDLVLAIAIYRPGPMQNIDLICDIKNNKRKYISIDSRIDYILKDTFGIIVYQEQIMEILRVMANYTYAHADIVRRAISKKDKDVMEKEKSVFINESINNGYSEEISLKVFSLIEKFAEFGFNKSHSVAYALIAYQMAYLKAHFTKNYYVSLLNTNIGGEVKIKEYIDEAKMKGIKFLKPDINKSLMEYSIDDEKIRLPLRSIKGLNSSSVSSILNERKNGEFKSFNDFMARCYGIYINKKTVETLIYAGVFDSFSYNRKTLINNIDSSITYAELIKDLDSSLVSEPVVLETDEFSDIELMNKEIELFGFYISNHPASKYPDCFKQVNIKSYFDKRIETVILIDKIHMLKTKNNDDMAFVTGSDETGRNEYVLFKEALKDKEFKVGALYFVKGKVERRFDKYQIIVSEINKV